MGSMLGGHEYPSGILLLDKPSGISSNLALSIAKRTLGIKKAGHTGSLDPLASGMLPLCFGEATKFARFLLEADKGYHVVAKLGVTTKTGDSEGDVVEERPVPHFTTAQIEQALESLRGSIEQIPPMYSALKHKGQPLYKLARAGKEVERSSRRVFIHRFELEGIKHAPEQTTLSCLVECTKGTYVRTLVEDLGQLLGCGAHVIALRRLWVGRFTADAMVTLPSLKERSNQENREYLLPIDSALVEYPKVSLTEESAFYLQRGQAVRVGKPQPGWVLLLNHQGDFLGMGEYLDDGRIAPRRLITSA